MLIFAFSQLWVGNQDQEIDDMMPGWKTMNESESTVGQPMPGLS